LTSQGFGPILGGVLTAGFNWRAIFWFLAIYAGTAYISFLIFFNDTFRQERSLTYQNLVMKRLEEIHNQSMLGDVEALTASSKTGVRDVSLEKHSTHMVILIIWSGRHSTNTAFTERCQSFQTSCAGSTSTEQYNHNLQL
jgi:MFS family permease